MRDEIVWSVADGIATVTLNRPDQRNAMNTALLTGLRLCFERLDERSDVRVVVVRGAGPAFCSGMDLKEMAKQNAGPAPRTRSEEHTSELQSRPHLVCRLLLEKKKNNPTSRVIVDTRVLDIRQ